MTEKQKYKLYFPVWSECAKANNWRMQKCRLVAEPPTEDNPQFPQRFQVWAVASQIAAKEHRAIKPDDLRHACHVVALDEDKSSAKLKTWEVNKIVALFKLLIDSDNISARLMWDHPQLSERDAAIQAILNEVDDAYITKISQDLFQTRHWRDLDQQKLIYLLRIAKKRSVAQVAEPDPF